MGRITELKSTNEKKLEKLLETTLIKYDDATNDMDRYRHKLIIDEIYSFERKFATKACSNLHNSIGYAYFLENYKYFERSLAFFTKKLIEEILYYKEDVESLVHESYNSFLDYKNDKPKTFLINIISKYDEDLSRYIKLNLNDIKELDNFINIVNCNWREFELEKSDYKRMISRLESYYDENGQKSSCSKIDLLVFLFSRNDLIDEFKKYYVMEDMTADEVDELIKENDIYTSIFSINDIKLIAEMDKIIKDSLSKNGKRLKF